MNQHQLQPVLKYLQRVLGPDQPQSPTDAELLERFVASRDQAAFELLVWRHQRMVLGLCQRVLRDPHDAEDAFQSTFLVLVQKAMCIRKRQAVASWLYQVAYRCAVKARNQQQRRSLRERTNKDDLEAVVAHDDCLVAALGSDIWPLLDEELQQLPENNRAALVLCYLEGKTYEQAARQMGCDRSTVSTRLAKARETLRSRLAARGVALSAGMFAAGLCDQAAKAAAPETLVNATTKAVALYAAGHGTISNLFSDRVAALVDGVTKMMLMTKLKTALALMLLGVCVAAAGIAGGYQQPAGRLEEGPARQPHTLAAGEAGETGHATADAYGDLLPSGALARLGTRRFRHDCPGYFLRVVFSPDGRTIASAGPPSPVVYLWDATTGREIRHLEGHRTSVQVIAMAPDGKTLASGSRSGGIRVWDAATGKQLQRLEGHGQVEGHQGAVSNLVFLPDSRSLISAGNEDKTIRVWDVANGKELRQIGKHKSGIAVALSPDGRTLVSSNELEPVRFWNAISGDELRQADPASGNPWTVAFSPDGTKLATAGSDPFIRLLDVATGKEVGRLEGHQGEVRSVAFSRDGETLLSAGEDNTVRLWDLSARNELRRCKSVPEVVSAKGTGYGAVACFSPDGKTVAVTHAYHNAVHLYDAVTGKELRPLHEHQGEVSAVFSPDGKLLASFGTDGIRLWNVATRKPLRTLIGDEITVGSVTLSGVGAVAFSPDGRILASGSFQTICLWDTVTGKKLLQWRDKDAALVKALAFSADGKMLASRSNTVRLWESATGREISQINQGDAMALSSDGRTLATFARPTGMVTINDPVTVYLWDAVGKEVGRLAVRPTEVELLAFSPDGKTLAIGNWCRVEGNDPPMRLWEIATGQERGHLSAGRQHRVRALAFSPDGNFLAWVGVQHRTALQSGTDPVTGTRTETNALLWEGAEHEIHVWDLREGREIQHMKGHDGEILSIAFSCDGRTLASGGSDSTVLLWDILATERSGGPAGKLGQAEMDALWADLASSDAPKAYRAIGKLAAAPEQAVSFLKEWLRAGVVTDPKRVSELIADLDSDQFAVREKAGRELENLGMDAEGALRKALEGQPSVEGRRRTQGLLERLERAEGLRISRAVEALERINYPAARQLLETLAKRAPGGRLSEDAKAAFQRLSSRSALGR
jgi:RNA polymerase sigma factor (sigma-70 family)